MRLGMTILAVLATLGQAAASPPEVVVGEQGEGRGSLAIAAHYSQWEGPYSSHGAGGRFRWEPLDWFGVEGTLEVLMTEEGGQRRVDVPLGSRAYAFWNAVPGVRLVGSLGLCAMFSMSDAPGTNTSSADDLLIGFRIGGGAELELSDRLSLFGEAGWQRYLGHSRKVSVWSDALDGALRPVDQLAVALGLLLWL
jgi:opacity protein-like surface antigen